MGIVELIFGNQNAKAVKRLQPIVDSINALEPAVVALSDAELQAKTPELRERLRAGETLDDILPEAFAVVREAAKRVLGQRHYDVQLIGGIVLHQGKIAEMRTGEGKTLTSTLAVYLNALSGRPVHVVTVNDYLARRDADWMGKLYHWLGLRVGCIQNQMVSYLFDATAETPADDEDVYKVDMANLRSVQRKEAYQADIVYGTNNEFGFDYLRDNLVQRLEDKVTPDLAYAIIDEVDSILIDEARTPLIISGPAETPTAQYYQFAKLVARLVENDDYNVDEKMRSAALTEQGIQRFEEWLGVENIYEAGGVATVHHIEQALKAHTLFKRDRDYVVQDGEIVIVDEFTGRLMVGRRYSEGLHQAIEAKENVKIQRESRTLATITFQNLFRMYEKLAGMTGTAETEKEELYKIYQLDVVVIPTNKSIARQDLSDAIYRTASGKFDAVINKINEYHAAGNPVLVGTISIEQNELFSKLLTTAGIEHNVLNAKNHEQEAEIIAQAGKRGAVTVATNMAGRGVDILLGGNPYNEALATEIRELGGLVVIGTERHESRRIDNQLRGRAGRQGDPGISQFFVSMEDDLMRIFATDRVRSLMSTLKWPEDMPIENSMVSRSIETAQKKVEGRNFDTREHLVKYDDIINKHRDVIYRKRDAVLGETPTALREMLYELVESEIENVVSFHTNSDAEAEWDMAEIYETMHAIFPIAADERHTLEQLQAQAGSKLEDVAARTKIIEHLSALARSTYEQIIGHINDAHGQDAVAEGAAEHATVSIVEQVERQLYLRSIDTLWIEHLDQMNYLREAVSLRGYGQRDPLVEYRKESYGLFTQLLANIQKQVVYSMYKMADAHQLAPLVSANVAKQVTSGPAKTSDTTTSDGATTTSGTNASAEKVGRNEKVTIQRGNETQVVKYKKAQQLEGEGWRIIS